MRLSVRRSVDEVFGMSTDQRRFFRCPISGDRTPGSLVVGSRRLPCLVQNVSIGGFGIEVVHDPAIVGAETAVLETRGRAVPVRIVHTNVTQGRLSLGLSEMTPEDRPSSWSAGRLRQTSFAIGAFAVVFLSALVLLAVHADRAKDWFEGMTSAAPNGTDRLATRPVSPL
jgi:hypothetical protein